MGHWVVESLALGIWELGFDYSLSSAVQLWAGHFTSLRLSFLVGKMETWNTRPVRGVKELVCEKRLAHAKCSDYSYWG